MRLSKTQKHAIQWMVSQDSNMKDIAKELKIPEKTVSNFVEKNCTASSNPNIKTASSSTKSKDLMIRHTAGKNNNNVAIMTQAAAEVNDEFKKKSEPPEPKYLKNIHKIS